MTQTTIRGTRVINEISNNADVTIDHQVDHRKTSDLIMMS